MLTTRENDVARPSESSVSGQVTLQQYQRANRWNRLGELILQSLLGGFPQPIGTVLRRVCYKSILGSLSSASKIHGTGVEFVGAHQIVIGKAIIMRDARLNAFAQNSRISVGDGAYLYRDVDISVTYVGDCTIEIGNSSVIGAFTCIHGPGHIKIGESCLIASHVGIYANNHVFSDPTRKIIDQGTTRKGIVIEDDCWLGTSVTVLDGVTIGRGSVIGAGAVVTKDIPPYSIAVGVPAKVVSSRLDQNS